MTFKEYAKQSGLDKQPKSIRARVIAELWDIYKLHYLCNKPIEIQKAIKLRANNVD